MTDQQAAAETPSRGLSSFAIPRAAVEALLNAEATAYEIAAYLVLARFTDASGRYSTASIAAIGRYTGANKAFGGPIRAAVERLKQIHYTTMQRVEDPQYGYDGRKRSSKTVTKEVDHGPILIAREAWLAQGGEALPDGPTERGKVQFVLPDFGEAREARVWIGGNLVSGVGKLDQPLKALKNAGSEAARLLLALYAANDMETWGGVRPVGREHGPWARYEPIDDKPIHLTHGARLIRSAPKGAVGSGEMFSRVWPAPNARDWWKAHEGAGGPVWRALEALQSIGLIYEVVMVLNREAISNTLKNGEVYGAIPNDAEPYYELDARSRHGYKPEGEEGIGGATARTAGDFQRPVTDANGRFNGTYAAIVQIGHPAMIVGIYRLRFRVANPKNAGIKGAWARIHQSNREAFEFLQAVRASAALPALTSPWDQKKAAKAAAQAVAQAAGGGGLSTGAGAKTDPPPPF